MANTLGGRIEAALDAADMTVKDLEAALEEEGVEGGSYANLHRLKSDKLDRPSAGLLYGIAKATGVRLPWLVARDGQMTEVESTEGSEREKLWKEIRKAHPETAYLSRSTGELFLSVLLRWVTSAPDVDSVHNPETRKALIALAGDLLFLIRLPLKGGSHGLQNMGTATTEQIESWNLTMLGALRGLMAPAREGVRIKNYDRSLIRFARKAVEEKEEERQKEIEELREEVDVPDDLISRKPNEEE